MKNKGKVKYLKHTVMLISIAFLFSSHNLHAGSYSYKFTDASELSIWDVSDSFSDSDDLLGCSIDLTLNQDSKGKITGGGSADCYIDEYDMTLEMTYDINGAITQKNGIANINISIRFKGNAYYQGEKYRLSASEKVIAEINPDDKTMTGAVKASVSVAGHRQSEKMPFSEPLSPDMDGAFALSFDANQAGKKLLGDAIIKLSNGDIYPFSVNGKDVPKKTVSKYIAEAEKAFDEVANAMGMFYSGRVSADAVKMTQFTLKGDDEDAKGCKLTIVIDEAGTIISLKGKVLGQALKYPVTIGSGTVNSSGGFELGVVSYDYNSYGEIYQFHTGSSDNLMSNEAIEPVPIE